MVKFVSKGGSEITKKDCKYNLFMRWEKRAPTAVEVGEDCRDGGEWVPSNCSLIGHFKTQNNPKKKKLSTHIISNHR